MKSPLSLKLQVAAWKARGMWQRDVAEGCGRGMWQRAYTIANNQYKGIQTHVADETTSVN